MAILLIEDDRLLRRAIEPALVKAGYEVIGIGDGEVVYVLPVKRRLISFC